MNKSEFIRAIAEKSGNSQAETKRFLEALTATVEETLAKGDKIFVTFPGIKVSSTNQKSLNKISVLGG